MSEYLDGPQSVFQIHLHIVWITKYRKQILTGEIALNLPEILRKICATESVNIIRGQVGQDHVRLFVSIRPKTTMIEAQKPLKSTIV